MKKLSIKIITLFPNFIDQFVDNFGIIKKAIKNGLLDIQAVNLRSFGLDRRQTVDDRPYGGGVGMVLRPDVLYKAIAAARKFQIKNSKLKIRTIMLTPQGKRFDQGGARRLAKYDQLILVCGRYEGFDERVRKFVDEELSIGDYVLMGGELPALVVSEAVMRLRPGILGKDESSVAESFSEGVLEYPHYTKPEKWKVPSGKLKGKILSVPAVLRSGHHKNIEAFRAAESQKRTKKRRPDLLV